MPGRQLFRPIMGRMIAGVCIGVAQTYGWDVALVRVLTVIGLFCSGGLVAVAYLAGWIGIPEEPYPMPGMYPPPGSGMYPPPGPGAYPPAGPGGVSS
ncbi:MAG TPA: PspC domain-containing protein [Terracidiphilus sp.]|nr:PspC domain-containing protein [Terracidiphilus sp.]